MIEDIQLKMEASSDFCFGRDEFCEQMVSDAFENRALLLFGGRQSGKTTILLRTLYLFGSRYKISTKIQRITVPIYFNLMELPGHAGPSFFWFKLASLINKEVKYIVGDDRGLDIFNDVKKDSWSLELIINYINKIDRLAGNVEFDFLFMLDESKRLLLNPFTRSFQDNLFYLLYGNKDTLSSRVAIIFAGAQDLYEFCEDQTSPIGSRAATKLVSPINIENAEEIIFYLEKKKTCLSVKNIDINTGWLAKKLYDLCGGHAGLISRMAGKLTPIKDEIHTFFDDDLNIIKKQFYGLFRIWNRSLSCEGKLVRDLLLIQNKVGLSSAAKKLNKNKLDPILAERAFEELCFTGVAINDDGFLRKANIIYWDHIQNIMKNINTTNKNKGISEELSDKMIDVAILTIKEEEYKAVLKSIGNTNEFSPGRRRYEIATLKCRNEEINIAITRCVNQGNISAQHAVTEIINDLSPNFILVVGIAGATPNKDITLGDVIVSSYVHDLTLEDTGIKGTKQFNAHGGPLHPDASAIVENLVAIERRIGHWQENIENKQPKIFLKFGTDDANWNEEIKNSLKWHKKRINSEPKVTAQVIAASDRLIKDPSYLLQWKSVLKDIVAIEMESAGALMACMQNNVAFLAIRGISDIVGLKRDEMWTLFACESAAVYAKALLLSGALISKPRQA